jgi:hypothetical protein
MSTEEELKWMTKRFSWRYIPFRYQAMVATIVSALLYFNLFQIFFEPTSGGAYACGTLLRPVMDGTTTPSWIWKSTPFSVDSNLNCPRGNYLLWWQALATFGALAICGLVMRRAIKREDAEKSR